MFTITQFFFSSYRITITTFAPWYNFATNTSKKLFATPSAVIAHGPPIVTIRISRFTSHDTPPINVLWV